MGTRAGAAPLPCGRGARAVLGTGGAGQAGPRSPGCRRHFQTPIAHTALCPAKGARKGPAPSMPSADSPREARSAARSAGSEPRLG